MAVASAVFGGVVVGGLLIGILTFMPSPPIASNKTNESPSRQSSSSSSSRTASTVTLPDKSKNRSNRRENEGAAEEVRRQRQARMKRLERAGVDVAKLRRLLREFELESLKPSPYRHGLAFAAKTLCYALCFVAIHILASHFGLWATLRARFPREAEIIVGENVRADL